MYAVTWNPGTFGHLLINVIANEETTEDIKSIPTQDEINSHFHLSGQVVKTIHPYVQDEIDTYTKTIKPYFKSADLKAFQWYRNEIAYLKSDRHFKEHLRQYWNFKEPLCDISYNIDMTEFLNNNESFCVNMAKFLNKKKLKETTLEFIRQKHQSNRDLYDRYLDRVVDTVRCLQAKNYKDIKDLTNIEIACVLCDFFHMDDAGTNNFCINAPDEKPVSTTEILSYA